MYGPLLSLETTDAHIGGVRNQPQAPPALTRYPVNMGLDEPNKAECMAHYSPLKLQTRTLEVSEISLKLRPL